MSKTDITTRLVRCPRCRKSSRYDVTNEFRPFCSAACKNDDIIQWADQGYRIPGKPADPATGEVLGNADDDDEH